MKKTSFRFTQIASAAALGLLISHAQLALAGWSGVMNGTGYGKASVNVMSAAESYKAITTTNMQDPSVAMSNTLTYVFGTGLPKDSSPATVAKVKGFSGYVWQATTIGSNGDSTDNSELESRVRVTAADCASLEMSSASALNTESKSGTITVNVKGTAGTAVWLRGFELLGGQVLPEDDLTTTNVDETLEFLKANGTVKWDVLYVGPMDLTEANCSAVKIPVTYETTPDNLYFVTDAVAKSLPLVIECPADIIVDCQQDVTLPETVLVGGCGNITVSFDPAPPSGGKFPAGFFPVGTTPVTVTATDKDGNTKSCTFNVVVTDTQAPVVPELPVLTGESSVTVPQPPNVIDNCGGTVSATTSDPLTYNTQGTFTVHWKYDDKHGNVTMANQTVIVDDVTPPTAPTIADAIGQCSATVTAAPTTTDNVAGTITGTTSDPLSYTAQGTHAITWTFDDGNGNVVTATQNVIVDDTIKPVAPTDLPTVTGNCSTPVTLTAPTATDNCAGTVTGTTTTTFPITTVGDTVVTWTFNDGNGNVSTAQQTVTVSGLEFHGFYSPIGGTGGTCDRPLRTANLGNNLPVKFDVECGGSRVVSGSPTLAIQKYESCNSTGIPILDGIFTLVGNEWHFNWATGSGGVTAGTYNLIATLQDGTQRHVWIKLR